MSVSQRELLDVEPAEEPPRLPEFIAPLPPLELVPPALDPLVPPRLEPLEPPALLPDEPPALPPVLPLEPPALAPALPPALPPAPPPDCAIAVIAKRAAAVAVTKSFNFIWRVLLLRWKKNNAGKNARPMPLAGSATSEAAAGTANGSFGPARPALDGCARLREATLALFAR